MFFSSLAATWSVSLEDVLTRREKKNSSSDNIMHIVLPLSFMYLFTFILIKCLLLFVVIRFAFYYGKGPV